MKTKFAKIAAAFLALAVMLLAAFPATALAAEGGEGGIGFYVQAVIPDNQRDAQLTYFDLKMEPGQTQELEIEIVNEQDEDITVSLGAISASTNPYGVIDYKTPDVRDETLNIPFSEIATLRDDTITVPAGGRVVTTVAVAMPPELYNGVVLGGIVITKEGGTPQEVAGGTVINNLYSYVIGVMLTETDTPVQPDFELFNVQADAVNYEQAVVHYIRNTQAAIVKDMELDVEVYRDGETEPVAHVQKTDVDMAPNSVMELAASLAGTTPEEPGSLAAGNYTSVVKLRYGGESWEFTQKFVVGGPEAERINNEAIPGTGTAAFPWHIVIIAAFVFMALVILLLVVLLLKRRKQQQ